MRRIIAKLDRYFHGSWRIGVLNPEKGLWTADTNQIAYLKAENANGKHILMQPDQEIELHYLLADDLTQALVEKHHQYPDGAWRPGRMVIETSPKNFQVWIRSSRSLSVKEKRYWLQRMHSDPGADPKRRWGRCPGFFNRKEKHRSDSGCFPLAKLIWVDWRNAAMIPPINDSAENKTRQRSDPYPLKHWNTIRRNDYERGNESVTDFAYALAMIRRNYPREQVIENIRCERTDWKNHSGEKRINNYLKRTVDKAWNIIHNQIEVDA